MPQPDALRCFPLGFADKDMVTDRRAPPIDAVRLVAELIATVLPEGLALADPAPAVHTLRDRDGDTLRSDEQGGERGGECLGLFVTRLGSASAL